MHGSINIQIGIFLVWYWKIFVVLISKHFLLDNPLKLMWQLIALMKMSSQPVEYPNLQICICLIFYLELFYLNFILNFGIPIVFVFQLEVYYKADRLLTGLTAQQKRATARLYSNKTSLTYFLKIMFNLNTIEHLFLFVEQ